MRLFDHFDRKIKTRPKIFSVDFSTFKTDPKITCRKEVLAEGFRRAQVRGGG